MKNKLPALIGLVPLVFLLNACVVAVHDGEGRGNYHSDSSREVSNREAIAHFTPGMNYSAVLGQLGTPDFTEAYEKDGENIQVLFFRTQRKVKDGLTTKEECTPLIFKQGVLDSWGERARLML